MSALTDLFTSFANKIRSKVGGSRTYTPLEMVDAIDDVYDAGAASVPTPTNITPSNSTPVALTADTPVNPTASGYAIASYQSKTPSTSGVSFNSGMVKMSSSGYAYSGQPTLKATTLWTNSSPTTTFAEQSITLSQDIDNFAYIGIKYRVSTTATSDETEILVTPTNLKKSAATASAVRIIIGANNSGGNRYDRGIQYNSDTSLTISGAYRVNTSGSGNNLAIPLYIYGYKVQA